MISTVISQLCSEVAPLVASIAELVAEVLLTNNDILATTFLQ